MNKNLLTKIEKFLPQPSHPAYIKSLYNMFVRIKEIPGDIIELGVAKGRNTIILGSLIKHENKDRLYHGFDTFKGYTEEDLKSSPHLIENQRKKRWNIPIESVQKTISNANLLKNCILHQGSIQTIFPDFIKKSREIAWLYIDCNAYDASITGMRLAINSMKSGSIISIDEHRVGGETKALKEFASEHNFPITYTNDKYGIPAYIKIP